MPPNDSFETLLAEWGVWCETGLAVTKQQVTSWLRQRSGAFRTGATFELQNDSCEYAIERAVSFLAQSNPVAALVIRAEYSVRYGATQAQRALKLDMTLRTYQRKLSTAKTEVYRFFNGD